MESGGGMSPYQRFPHLVWKMIFDQIESAEDKLSLMMAYSDLDEQFQNKKLELLFLAVLPILMNNFDKPKPDWTQELNNERRQLILTSRLVSKTSCKVIDKWLEAHWEKEEASQIPLVLCGGTPLEDLATRGGVRRFLQLFDDYPQHRMPVLSRSVTIAIPTLVRLDEWGEDLDAVVDLEREIEDNQQRVAVFSKIGANLKDLLLFLSTSNVEIRMDALKTILQYTPNLRSLCVYWMPAQDNRQHLILPDLPRLTFLSLISPDEMPNADFTPLERYFPQLKQLEFYGLDGWKDGYSMVAHFPKLLHLKLRNVHFRRSKIQRKRLLNIFRTLKAPLLRDLEVETIPFNGNDPEAEARTLLRVGTLSLNKLFKNVKWEGCLGESQTGQVKNTLQFSRV